MSATAQVQCRQKQERLAAFYVWCLLALAVAGWIGTTKISWLHFPDWSGTWFSLFANVETLVAQTLAVLLVVGSYLAAQYVRVWRPRRRGSQAARLAVSPPDRRPLSTRAPESRPVSQLG